MHFPLKMWYQLEQLASKPYEVYSVGNNYLGTVAYTNDLDTDTRINANKQVLFVFQTRDMPVSGGMGKRGDYLAFIQRYIDGPADFLVIEDKHPFLSFVVNSLLCGNISRLPFNAHVTVTSVHAVHGNSGGIVALLHNQTGLGKLQFPRLCKQEQWIDYQDYHVIF